MSPDDDEYECEEQADGSKNCRLKKKKGQIGLGKVEDLRCRKRKDDWECTARTKSKAQPEI